MRSNDSSLEYRHAQTSNHDGLLLSDRGIQMKKLVMEITCCAECPFNSWESEVDANMWGSICTETETIIEDEGEICDNCPLEDL